MMTALRFQGRKIDTVSIPQTDVRNETKALQAIIGGYIECIRITDDAVMLVDEDGLAKCLPPNPAASAFAGQLIIGTALVVGLAENADGELYFTDCPHRYGFAQKEST